MHTEGRREFPPVIQAAIAQAAIAPAAVTYGSFIPVYRASTPKLTVIGI
jgi:hypothetical protein